MRINVIGTSGCGKSTFARQLAKQQQVPYVEIDALNWKPNWTESTDEELITKLKDALSVDAWVIDGNYSRTRTITWERVQQVVYLDLPFYIVLYRIVVRSLTRGLTGEVLWAGNKESLWKHLFTRDSMILWTISNFHRNRKKYAVWVNKAEYSDIQFLRLRSRKEVADCLQTFGG
jgi:adenylate kinase family enzyme